MGEGSSFWRSGGPPPPRRDSADGEAWVGNRTDDSGRDQYTPRPRPGASPAPGKDKSLWRSGGPPPPRRDSADWGALVGNKTGDPGRTNTPRARGQALLQHRGKARLSGETAGLRRRGATAPIGKGNSLWRSGGPPPPRRDSADGEAWVGNRTDDSGRDQYTPRPRPGASPAPGKNKSLWGNGGPPPRRDTADWGRQQSLEKRRAAAAEARQRRWEPSGTTTAVYHANSFRRPRYGHCSGDETNPLRTGFRATYSSLRA